MKVANISRVSYRQPHFKANDFKANDNTKNTESFEKFMLELDNWTSQELGKIGEKTYKNRLEKEIAIEYLFYLRETNIKRFKESLKGPQKVKWWQKILNKLA